MAILSDSPSPKRHSVMSFDRFTLVTIRFGKGEQQQEFVVHESFVSRAEFFRRALNGSWIESRDRVDSLPEDDPETFALYMTFLYTGKLPRDDTVTPVDSDEWQTRCDYDYLDMAFIYGMAEKLQDINTKNAVVRCIFETVDKRDKQGSRCLPPGSAIRVFYDTTVDSSPIRRLLPAMWSTVDKSALTDDLDDLPKLFLA
ncbi:hypothetical protein M011DRAFT_18563 [Sporormia fimetaria CBS 119925]|uniref:BTB domain-containing protein n=1 Tax=Sporormia fimetaria CBS 119925 TaxID=1340428 RepID=A0A6A6VRK9_9PLEO|nr:hypothetical protein M011DRAFT_18563 [Sporormia fimetaria CBS 119925]